MYNENGYADVNKTRLYYEIVGSGETLILLHAFGMDTRQWDDQFELFSQHYRVIRFDLRGFGKSAVPTQVPYTHMEDLKALLDYLEINKAHILGHCYGMPSGNQLCYHIS